MVGRSTRMPNVYNTRCQSLSDWNYVFMFISIMWYSEWLLGCWRICVWLSHLHIPIKWFTMQFYQIIHIEKLNEWKRSMNEERERERERKYYFKNQLASYLFIKSIYTLNVTLIFHRWLIQLKYSEYKQLHNTFP